MKSLTAAALLLCVRSQDLSEETSLMQGLAHRVDGKLSVAEMKTSEGRKDATAKLLETATNMIKNGVTPDVVTFIDATRADILEVFDAIRDDHTADQNLIDTLCDEINDAVKKCEEDSELIDALHGDRTVASTLHKQCRSTEALHCARSRRCEAELEQLWIIVKREEMEMRSIHTEIEKEWCVHPPDGVHPDLTSPFHWTDPRYHEGPETSQIEFDYHTIALATDVADFRMVSVIEFGKYIEQKPVVERAWNAYNAKIIECASLELVFETQIGTCDELQDAVRDSACEHAATNREARQSFGHSYATALAGYEIARLAVEQQEYDRKREWETLTIVDCLLERIHTNVIDADGEPCITTESHPEETEAQIYTCHELPDDGSFTIHLDITYCVIPPPCPLPPVIPPPCTAEYVWDEQGSFTSAIQASHIAALAADEGLGNYFTVLSNAGWAGCAAPKVCIPCEGTTAMPANPEITEPAVECKVHELYLRPGQSNADSFHCTGVSIGGTPFCVPMSARCNGVQNCGDNSDEQGCETSWKVPAVLQLASTEECSARLETDVQFTCSNGQCTSIEGRCNGISNCDDNSDEADCPLDTSGVTLEPTSGLVATVETLTSNSLVFHDRSYTLDSLGSFGGYHFIKASNEDKHTEHSHVQTKLRLPRPLTVYVVKLTGLELPWLVSGGWQSSALTGVSYSGARPTKHTEWSEILNTDEYGPGDVYEKTFPAGVVTMPGNSGGDGSYLMVLSNPGNPPNALENAGENCWAPCGTTGGYCDWCGSGNACCRAGFNDPAECALGSYPDSPPNYHSCVHPASPEPYEEPVNHGSLLNAGENCWSPCSFTGGHCDWCGVGNACCRGGWADPPECMGVSGLPNNFHTCAVPEYGLD